MDEIEVQKHIHAITGAIIADENSSSVIESEKIEDFIGRYAQMMQLEFTQDQFNQISFVIGNRFDVGQIDQATIINSKEVARWFDDAKTEFDWEYWQAYKSLLLSQERTVDVIDENEKVIDNILDLSGDPRIPGKWNRRGLVMGNVQSGKTQNYLGLINKAMDCGYRIIILLGGGNSNDLRKQTQSRVDEGIIGRKSRHLIQPGEGINPQIGVGKYRNPDYSVATLTSTENDFKGGIAKQLGISLKDLNAPIIFTIKKNTKIMNNLCEWIKNFHDLEPLEDRRLDLPLLLIDDEADYATPNSRKDYEKVTRTNELIRQTLNLFNKSTYIGYTATPFANIFIHPESFDEALGDDLYPEDFMIKVPPPENYLGQNFYFENQNLEEIGPIEIIDDNELMLPMTGQKPHTPVGPIAPSLKEAIRAFVISCSIRDARGQNKDHKSMIVNITHLNALQGQITNEIDNYLKELKQAIHHIDGQTYNECSHNATVQELLKTFNTDFNVPEDFDLVLKHVNKAANKIKLFGVNTETKVEVDYSIYPNGLSAIIVGGYKLSRGLTLEGLSVSYYARNSKLYDTLMQMCRWFGYRPGYKDLCKVYLPAQSNDWYVHISNAINDLYAELQRMENQQKTPRDFGLRVRSHSGALQVTARNKMRAAVSSIVNIDLWGQRQRRFRFDHNTDHDKNLELSEKFIAKLQNISKPEIIAPSGSLLFNDVEHEDIINYIESMSLVEDDLGDQILINHIRQLKGRDLPKFKVCIRNVSNSRKFTWESDPRFQDQKLLEEYEFCGYKIKLSKRNMKDDGKVYMFPSHEMGSQTDEQLFLSNDEIKIVKSIVRNPSSHHFIASEARDFPGLTIYPFSPAIIHEYTPKDIDKINSVKLISDKPVIGFSVSFPLLEHHKHLSQDELKSLKKDSMIAYDCGVVWQQMELFHQSEDEDEDE